MDINPKLKKGILVALVGTITAASFLFDGFLARKGNITNEPTKNQPAVVQTIKVKPTGEQIVNAILGHILEVKRELNSAKKAIEDNNPDKALNHLVNADAHLQLLRNANIDVRELQVKFLDIRQQLLNLKNK